ncbi:MAG TPA: zf-HC2 domain-containing protein [Longimicrobiales bacterium]
MDRSPLTCQEFLARHSDYLDGELDVRESVRMEAHRASCPKCARYDRTVRHGVRLLRALPEVEPSQDFLPRLQHRIYTLEEESRSGKRATGVGALASLAVAGTIALLAWSPVLRLGLGAGGAGAAAGRGPVAEAPTAPGGPGGRPSPARPEPSPRGGVAVQLAAEAEDLPRIDPRSVPWGTGSIFDVPDAGAESWWWVGAAAGSGTPVARRPLRMVDFRAPGPYSPLIVEAPTFRRATVPSQPGDTRPGRD